MSFTGINVNTEILILSWPIVYGIYFPIAFKNGGISRLWGDTRILVVITFLFSLFYPRVYVYYVAPLNASGIDTIFIPLSVFSAALATRVSVYLKVNIFLQYIFSIVLAMLVLLLGASVE